MSNQITTAFVQEYGQTVELLAQQRGSRLLRAVRMERVRGRYHYFDQIGATTAQRTNTRHADSPLSNTEHARRRVGLENIEWGDLVDDFDMVRTLIDPTNAYVLNAGYAVGREMDDIILEAFYDTVYIGETGSSSEAWSGNIVAVNFSGSNEDLTVAKLREARRMLRAGNVDLMFEPAFIAVTASQIDNLLGETEVISRDFSRAALESGEVQNFMGFNFIHTERVDTDSSGYRRVPVWVPSGMAAAVGMEPHPEIAKRADKRFSTYVYWAGVFGAVRMELAKVVEIKCDES